MYKNLSRNALGRSVSFEETCALAQQHNFTGVELDMSFLRGLGTASAPEWFDATGLTPGGYPLDAAWRETDSDEAFVASLPIVATDALLAAALDCKRCFTTISPSSETLDFYQHFDLVVPRLIRVAEVLASHGVMLGFEFISAPTMRPRHHKDFVHTLDGARTFAASIGMHSLNTGVVLDSVHWQTSGGSVQEIEHLDHHEVVFTYLDDPVTADETKNVAGLLGGLRTIGYVGPLTMKSRDAAANVMSPSDAAAEASAALDRILG
jgi:sugar phosphate isomerase/epimerase